VAWIYLKNNRKDIGILFGLTAVAAILSYQASRLIAFDVWDVWFESSFPRVYETMILVNGDHSRDQVHPLFSLLAYTPTWFARKCLGLAPIVAARLVLSVTAAIWISLIYILLRLLGCSSLDSGLLSGLALSSAGAMFWLPTPETYPFGSCSLLLALLLVKVVPPASFWGYVAVNVVSMSVTITNWMLGIFATIGTHKWKQSVQIIGMSFLVVLLLSGLQKLLFPPAKFLFQQSGNEMKYLLMPEAGGPVKRTIALVFHSMVMPQITMVKNQDSLLQNGTASINLGAKMTVQFSQLGSGTKWAVPAVVMWVGLLSAGFWALITMPAHPRFRLVLGLLLGGQWLLHLVYGEETFLYAIHVIPLLIVMVGMATLTPARRAVLALTAILFLCGTINNSIQFKRAVKWQDGLRQAAETGINSSPEANIPIP
jgi:hypothetical protein